MAIPTIQRDAFVNSLTFNNQVAGSVTSYALYLNNQHPDLDPGNRAILANAIRSPQSYGFSPSVVSDTTWSLTYDGWATDPNAAATQQAIDGGVQAVFSLLTGFQLPPP